MSAAPGPEAVGAVPKVLLVQSSEHLAERSLHDLILQARDADWSGLAASFLGDVHPTDWLVPVEALLHPSMQVLEVLQQLRSVVLLRHPVEPHRRIRADAVVGSFDAGHINQMGQRVELAPRFITGSLRYPQQLR